MPVDFDRLRLGKRNQILQVSRIGASIRIKDVIKFDISDEDYEISEYVMETDVKENGRKSSGKSKIDELFIYEHINNFRTYHDNLKEDEDYNPIDAARELSSGYYIFDEDGKLTNMIIYFYFIDVHLLNEKDIQKKMLSSVLGYVIDKVNIDQEEEDEEQEEQDDSYEINLFIVHNSDKVSDMIIKDVEPMINVTQGITLRHINLKILAVSSYSHVLSPTIRIAEPETVQSIKEKLKSGDNVFGTIYLNDPLIKEAGIAKDTIIEVDTADGYRNYKKVVGGSIPYSKVN